MKTTTVHEAQNQLSELLQQAQGELILLTDEEGHPVGLLTGIDEDDLDDLLVQTPGFQAMIARSRSSMESGEPVALDELLMEARAELTEEGS